MCLQLQCSQTARFWSPENSLISAGQTRNRIARLDATTGVADSFYLNASADVYAIVVQADGKILAGGQFSTIGGQTRNRIARLDAATGVADSFNPNADSNVFAIALQGDGKILAGGNFYQTLADSSALVSPVSMQQDRIGGFVRRERG